MLEEVKKCAENHDIKGLRYIFVDCLDVDPTFVRYREEYEYCKSVEGLFEPYISLTALEQDESRWDMEYWDQLKIDLLNNFSSRRFEHMIEVAKVVYKDKIARLLQEREKQQVIEEKKEQMSFQSTQIHVRNNLSVKELQEKKIKEKQRDIEKYNEKEYYATKREEKARIEKTQQELKQEKQNVQSGDTVSKKWLGIALAAIIVIVLLVIIL